MNYTSKEGALKTAAEYEALAGFFALIQFHFEPFFSWVAWVESFWSSLGYKVAWQHSCCLGLDTYENIESEEKTQC